MMKTVFLVLAFGVSNAALGQQRPEPDPRESAAAGGSSNWRCEVMSREEMLFCQAAKESGASGVRNGLCESVSAETIERCLVQQESVSSDPANEFRDRDDPRRSSG